jgi:hypothetical protein
LFRQEGIEENQPTLPQIGVIHQTAQIHPQSSAQESQVLIPATVIPDLPSNSTSVDPEKITKRPWTEEEVAKLKELLIVYPEEEVVKNRFEKIAKAMGTRTAIMCHAYYSRLSQSSSSASKQKKNSRKSKMGARETRISGYQYLSRKGAQSMPHHGYSCDACKEDPIVGVNFQTNLVDSVVL